MALQAGKMTGKVFVLFPGHELTEVGTIEIPVVGVSAAEARVQVDASYEATRARMADDPQYLELVEAADREARETPGLFIARNHLTIFLELHTPFRGGVDVSAFTD